MRGSTASCSGRRSGPRSSPTTVRPAMVNSFAIITPVKSFAIGLPAPGVCGPHAGNEKLVRSQRQLVSLFGRPLDVGTRAIHAVTAAPGARELPVDEDRNAAFAARR